MAITSTDGDRLSLSFALVLGLATGLLYFLLALALKPDATAFVAGLYGLVCGVVTTGIAWARGRFRLPRRLFPQPAHRVIE
jgi:hypothetical protein